tara:strand:+ start:456 stop:2597 length:2142 start_codon:yes stop_codon:yes gene_type:complete
MIKKIATAWFSVDSRTLGIYRILLGWLCFWDIARRWNYIDVFYSDLGIKTQFVKTTSFTIFKYIGNESLIIHIVFMIGMLFSILLMLGYKSKLSHFITAIIIISIHVFVTKVGNSGDMFLNCMLIWTLFLPLGKSLSLDSLINSLFIYKENTLDDLNNKKIGNNPPIQIYSIAYFAVLFQISAIYFFTALDKHGYDWTQGKAFYKMHHLDGFITLIGYYARDYITYPISKIFTLATLYLEYSVVFLLFIPFYKHILRLIAIISLTIFHLMIRISMNIGLFSQTMITSFALLLDQKVLDGIKHKMIQNYKNQKFTLFYDADCGFCHYTVRIIKRLDVFHRIIFDNGLNANSNKPENFDDLSDKTVVLYKEDVNKLWTRHRAFGKILFLLPFGFLIGWIFFIPFLSKIFGIIYDLIAQNRTKISILFGLPACSLPGTAIEERKKEKNKKNVLQFISPIKNHAIKVSKILSPIILIIMLSAGIQSALIENPGVQSFLVRNKLIESKAKPKGGRQSILNKGNYFNWENKRILEKIARFPRMIQMWKMFSPNVLSRDNIIIIEAFLNNGDVVDPFTGKKPVLNSTDYSILMTNNSQLWRKYFENFKRFDATRSGLGSFKNWIMNPKNNYFKKNLNGQKIDSIKIWKISQSSPNILINKDGSFNGIKLPSEPKKECLSIKKIKHNTNRRNSTSKKPDWNKQKREPAQDLKEYFKRHQKK